MLSQFSIHISVHLTLPCASLSYRPCKLQIAIVTEIILSYDDVHSVVSSQVHLISFHTHNYQRNAWYHTQQAQFKLLLF